MEISYEEEEADIQRALVYAESFQKPFGAKLPFYLKVLINAF